MLSIRCNNSVKSWRNKKDSQRIIKIKPLLNKYNWKETNLQSRKGDWKKFEKNNGTIVLSVLYAKKEKIYTAYVSRHNSNREKQVILLKIPNEEEWHYLTVKKLLALLWGKTSKHHHDFHFLNCHHSSVTESKGESHKKVCESENFVTL